jgi:hypothetical protein
MAPGRKIGCLFVEGHPRFGEVLPANQKSSSPNDSTSTTAADSHAPKPAVIELVMFCAQNISGPQPSRRARFKTSDQERESKGIHV